MDFTIATSRVASLVDGLRSADWEHRLGQWTVTYLAFAVAWLFLKRGYDTAEAVFGNSPLPGYEFGLVQLLIDIPVYAVIDMMGIGAVYLLGIGMWGLASRRWHIETPRRRFLTLLGAMFGLFGAILALEAAHGAYLVTTGELTTATMVEELLDIPYEVWDVVALWPLISAMLAGVASWRRGEFELTARRRQMLAIAAVVIIVAPAVLGAVGVGVFAEEDPHSYNSSTGAEAGIADSMDDGLSGPYRDELSESDLHRRGYRPASALLGCRQVNQSVYETESYMSPDYPASTTMNVSTPSDSEQTYIELAPYSEDGRIVDGRYAFRVANDGWTLLDTWYWNAEYEGGEQWNGTTGAYHTYDESVGTVAMENTEAVTIGFDLVNEDDEIVRVQYRFCRSDAAE